MFQRISSGVDALVCWQVARRMGLSPQLVLQGIDGILRGEQIRPGHFPVTLDGMDPSILMDQRHQFIAFCGMKFSWPLLQDLIR